jgi:hypothetical protein
MKTPGLNHLREVREMVVEKRKARKRWRQTRCPEDKKLLNTLCEQLKQEIRKIKNESFTRFLSDLSEDEEMDYSLWKASKYLKRPQKITDHQSVKMMVHGQEIIYKKQNCLWNIWLIPFSHISDKQQMNIYQK